MRRSRRSVISDLALLAGAVACTSIPQAALACVSAGPGFRQITTERPDMPKLLYDAYRMDDDGRLQMASWTSRKRLMTVSADRLLSPDLAAAFRAMVDDTGAPAITNRNAPSQPGPSAELGRLSGGGTASATVAISPELADLIKALQAGTPHTTIEGRAFIWTKPLPRTRPIDIDLTKSANCGTPVAGALADALARGRLIVPLSGGEDDYFTGALANRMQFGARFDGGYLGYGVLAA
jgi:hypothetical protein